jgi:hypothetical protein
MEKKLKGKTCSINRGYEIHNKENKHAEESIKDVEVRKNNTER